MRLVARTLGELLVTAGALVLLFLVWQLAWTDVAAASTQREAIASLQQRWEPSPVVAGQPPAEPPAEPPPAGPAPVDPASAAPPVLAEPAHGEPFAVVHVPRFGPGWAVGASQGVSLGDVLNTGVLGHYPGTAMPGAVGNAAFAGHRTTYGKPLAAIADLVEGDPLVVETEQAWYVYRVTGHVVVPPSRVDVIAPVPGDPSAQPVEAMITLTACHPRYSARERYVVHGALASWQPREAGPPPELAG